MGWFERHFGETPGQEDQTVVQQEQQMSPGLTGEYDWELREKAGLQQPPPLPEYMGLEGEYDPTGLAKRVAIAFDQDPDLGILETLNLVQDGGTIILQGEVANDQMLNHLIEVAAHVDGTRSVDASQVVVAQADRENGIQASPF